jgi:hypothetical protein
MKVITYQAANGATINLTRAQIKALDRARVWPKNSRGEEYATVSHGLHAGEADCDSCCVSDILEAAGDARKISGDIEAEVA